MIKIKSLLLNTHFLNWVLIYFTFLLFLYKPEEFFKAKVELIVVAIVVVFVKILEAVYFSIHTKSNYRWWPHFVFNNWRSLEIKLRRELMRISRKSGIVKWISIHIGASTWETLGFYTPLLVLSIRDTYFAGLVVIFTVLLFARIHFYPKISHVEVCFKFKIKVFFWGLVFAILVLVTQTLIYTIILHFAINMYSTYRYKIKSKLKSLKTQTAHCI